MNDAVALPEKTPHQTFSHPLDNVIWQALTSRQTQFAEAFGQARRFQRDVTSLNAILAPTEVGYASLAALVGAGGTAALFLEEPFQATSGWVRIGGAPLLEMVCEARPPQSDASFDLIELGKSDSPEMVELASLTRPGPFGTRTHELGTYLGIRRNGRLAAMAGERLKVPGHTEISAVCTHPDHVGKGYAQALMGELMQRLYERGETAFLHVREENVRAVGIYQKLGFTAKKKLHFVILRRTAG